MNDKRLADLLASLGIINKHDTEYSVSSYSVKPHGKMCFFAEEIVLLPTVADAVQELCLTRGFPLRISHRDTKYIVIVEKSWVTIENEDLNRAIVEACAVTLEGAQ
jgi:hypothetical protein